MAETEAGRMLRTYAELGVREVKALVTEQERRTAGELASLLAELLPA